MADPVKRRPYRSPARDAQAQATRDAVLRAARVLFTTTGYAATTVAAVAAAAGVSVDTVYASVGRKPRLLLAVHDMELAGGDQPLPAAGRDYVRDVRAAAGARAKLETYAAALGRRLPATVPLQEALEVAGRTDPACRRVHEELSDRRRANMRLLAEELRATGELRDDLPDETVADLLWTMNSPAVFRSLTRDRGPERYADVVADVWVRTFLAWLADEVGRAQAAGCLVRTRSQRTLRGRPRRGAPRGSRRRTRRRRRWCRPRRRRARPARARAHRPPSRPRHRRHRASSPPDPARPQSVSRT